MSVSRAPSLRLLDRHRPVKGVKVLHCMYCLSVKCAFHDDERPARGSDTVIGPSCCRSAPNFNAIGRSAWQSPVSACHWRSALGRGLVTFVVSVRLAGRTHEWADHSGDSDARTLATNCQKPNSKNGESAGKRNFSCGSLCGRLAARC